MSAKLKVVMIASECVPFVKTGGLADVAGALPKALHQLGHEVRVILPKYGKIDTQKFGLKSFHSPMGVWMGNKVEEWCSVDETQLDGVPFYFIESDKYFARSGIYNNENNIDYRDNAIRYAFFSRAALQLCIDRNFAPDIIHVHDWQTALAAAYQKVWHWNDSVIGQAASVLTIHNIDYQGNFSAMHYPYIGLGAENLRSEALEDNGRLNFLKGGIYFADSVTTVSPTYANETQNTYLGRGMGPYLNAKGGNYMGILNGVDYADWNPESDTLIPANYNRQDLTGKGICKAALQQKFHLEQNPSVPLMGIVSRVADQKGLDILYEALQIVLPQMNIQFVLLGSGDKALEGKYMQLPAQFPGRVGSFIGYDNPLAHQIEAGADFFVMPSRFEPCGLNQLYSLRYGTLPIVRSTGGLADTVAQYNEYNGEGTGFKYMDNTPHALANTIGWAVSTWYDRKHHIMTMIDRAMQQDFGWENSAKKYVDLYNRIKKK